jgi:hypothetical protein
MCFASEESFAEEMGKSSRLRFDHESNVSVLRGFPQGTLIALLDRERTLLEEG